MPAKNLQKDRNRWHKRKNAGQTSRVVDLSEREKRYKRRYWKEAQQRCRAEKQRLEELTPPQSPEPDPEPQISRQRRSGRRQLKRQNSKLYKEIEKLKILLKKKTTSLRNYQKRLTCVSESPRSKTQKQIGKHKVSAEVKTTLLFHNALIDNIRQKYQDTKKERVRQIISRIVSGKIIKNYKLQKTTQNSLGFSRKRFRNQSEPIFQRRKYRSTQSKLQKKVQEFFLRDDVSRLTAGKKQTITRGNAKVQKRFLNDTIKNLHHKFLLENPSSLLSYALFCCMRPFWVVHPSISDRDTCLCKVHENLSFLVQKLHTLKLLGTTNLEIIANSICCDPASKECMYGEFAKCRSNIYQLNSEYDAEAPVGFFQWTTELGERKKKNKESEKESQPVRMTVKREMECSLGVMTDRFQNQLRVFTRHHFNIKTQYNHYRELKKNMKSDECLIHIDFSENYACKLSAEIQAVHFASSQQQATLHTGILHVGGVDKHLCFTTISTSKEKSPPAIWTHLSLVLDHVKTHHPSVSLVHFFSDGPCTQYRQKGNFYMFSTELFKKGFKKGTWSFFEASHGKGAPDRVGGVLKRTADRLVSEGKDIQNAKTLYDCLLNVQTSIQLFYIDEEAVGKAVEKMPKQLPVVPSTMSLHQMITLTPGKIIYRDVSCLCSTKQILECVCHNTQRFEFDVQPILYATTESVVQPTLSDTTEDQQSQKTHEINWEIKNFIGQWCVIKFDDAIYPGTIVEVNETHAKV